MQIPDQVTTLDQLESMYRAPSPLAVNKVVTSIDDATVRFIDRCPFIVLATTDGSGSVDASPRGGPPGFVQRLDDRHVAIPDLNGNNRLDSLRNIVAHGRAGLLMLVPGKTETVRINGPATLTTAPAILGGFPAELRRPKLAIVVETDELFGHCAKAVMRAGLWQPDTWASLADAPDLAEILVEQTGGDVDATRERLQEAYDAYPAKERVADRPA